jgi:hypothetical protein
MPNVCLRVSSNHMDRPNPICHLISCPAFLDALQIPFLLTDYITSCPYNVKKTEHQYVTVLIIIQYCIHFTDLHIHFGVTIFTIHLSSSDAVTVTMDACTAPGFITAIHVDTARDPCGSY